MATSTQGQQPSPVLFFQTINAYQQTAALRAAIELDLFTALHDGPADARTVARDCQASERGMRILCDFLTIHGFLIKEEGLYRLTADSAFFLSRVSPAYLGGAVRFIASPMLTKSFEDLATVVRTGTTTIDHEGVMAHDHPIWVDFAEAMAPVTVLPANAIAQLAGPVSKVLDIAAGHGLFGITVAKQNPQAEIVAVDWDRVLDVARRNAQQAGIAERFHAIPGSAFEVDLGSGYDLVLLTNFLHHFGPQANEQLLAKVHAALRPGGRVATLEFVPNDDRISPPVAASFSLMMLGATAEGDAYTFAEFERMFRRAGFPHSELHPLPGGMQSVIVSSRE